MIDIQFEEGFGEESSAYYVNEPICVKMNTVEVSYARAISQCDLAQVDHRNLPIAFVDCLIELHEGLSEEAAYQIYQMRYEPKTTTNNNELIYSL